MKRIIAIMGSHGSGKSTLALSLSAELKKRNPNLTIAYLTGVARSCPYPINQESSREAQTWIFTKQMNEELSAINNNDLVISDRSIFDSLVYALVHCQNFNLNWPWTYYWAEPWALDHAERYYQQIIFVENSQPIMADGVRDPDLKYKKRIDAAMKGYWNALQQEQKLKTVELSTIDMAKVFGQESANNSIKDILERV